MTGENKLGKKELTLLKSQRPATGFVRRAEEAPPDETLFLRLAPILAVLALLLAVIVAAVSGCGSDFVYIFSALLTPAVPFMALSAFALPYFLGTARVFRVGGAIAGWSGLCDLGVSKSIIVTDRDLFPEECVTMESVRIFADGDAQNVISYAGTMVAAVWPALRAASESSWRKTAARSSMWRTLNVSPAAGQAASSTGTQSCAAAQT